MQSLAAPREHFCAKLFSDYKEFDPECFLALLHDIARAACKDIWYFMYTFSKEFICFRHEKCAFECRIFNSGPIFEISLHVALLNTYTALPVQHTRTQK